jgi:hypothetical protein
VRRGRFRSRVAALLHEAGETHHLVYRIVDGDDPDWVSWYADWLIELCELLGGALVRSELVWLLVELDKDYAAMSPDTPWPDGYAPHIVEHLAAGFVGPGRPPAGGVAGGGRGTGRQPVALSTGSVSIRACVYEWWRLRW